MLIVIKTLEPWDPRQPIFKTITAEEMAIHDPKRMVEGQESYEVGVRYPPNIGEVWSDEELAEIGLARSIPFETPEGKRRVGVVRYELKKGKVYEAYDTEDVPARVEAPESTKDELLVQIEELKAKIEELE